MKEVLIIIGVGAVAVAIVAGALFWYTTTKPLYEPGMVRSGRNLRASLSPPQQPDVPNVWKVEEDIQLYDVVTADEAFFTSTPYCLLPATRINGITIGDGVPGPITRRLLEAWSAMVEVDIVKQAASRLCAAG